MKKTIFATVANMAASEILDMIPQDTIARIKKNDQNPEFRAYVIGHEGTAHGVELSFGTKMTKALQYAADVVMGIFGKTQFGTPLYENHGAANTGDGRLRIGEIVGKSMARINEKVSAIAVAYLYPQYRDRHLDVASIEANIEYVPESDNKGSVLSVDNISGIALGSSKLFKPAFPGATLLGIVQAFQSEIQNEEGHMKTKEEIRAAIKEAKLKVNDIFDKDEIMTSEPVVQTIEVERGHAKRIEKQLGEEREKTITLTREKEDLNGKLKSANEKLSSTNGRTLFDNTAKERKLNDKEKAFIQKNIDKFKSGKEGAELKTEFDKFVDGQLADFKDYAKMMGIKVDERPADQRTDADADKDKGKGGAGTTDGTGAPEVDEEMLDPKKNDFIPA